MKQSKVPSLGWQSLFNRGIKSTNSLAASSGVSCPLGLGKIAVL